MNYKSILGIFTTLVLAGTSCADFDPLEYQVDKPESVAMQEEINAFDPLLSYVETEGSFKFKIGASINATDYLSKGVLYRLINSNFNDVTLNAGMTHGGVVQAGGNLNLAGIMDFLSATEEKGISTFGHALAWHSNQNSTYLSGLIAPLVVNSPPFANSLNKSGLANGSFQGWAYTNSNSTVSVVDNEGMGGSAKAIKLQSGVNSSAATDLQLVSPEISVIPGHDYEVVVYIKSDVAGKGRISFEGLLDNTPQRDWMNLGVVTETFTTNLSWGEIRFIVSDFEGDSFRIKFDLGYESDVTYYIDLENLYVYDTKGAPIVSNLISGGDFESGIAWGGWGNNSTRNVTAEGQGMNNSRAFFVTNPSLTGGFWEVQSTYPFAEPLEQGETYNLSFWVKGTNSGIIRPELQSANFSSNGFGMVYVTEEWQHVKLSTTATTADRIRLIISYGEFAGTVYMDDFVLSSSAVQGGTTTIVPRTPAEKRQIVGTQMENWISGMVTAASPYVKTWNVVNEPMDDNNPSELRSGMGTSPGTGVFYWQDYLGKEYGVKAFQLARNHGNPSDLLFINDSGLEANLDKCNGLIAYVAYLEDHGAQVDGIGTTMNLTLDSNIENIATMFQRLSATGKKIRVSGLEIRLMNAQPSQEMLMRQSEMYKDVLKLYAQHVPESQQYGITLAGAIDSSSNSSWRQGLWNANLTRKPSYAGFATGLER